MIHGAPRWAVMHRVEVERSAMDVLVSILLGSEEARKGSGRSPKGAFAKLCSQRSKASLELRASIEAQGLLKSAAPGRAGRRFS